MAYIPMIDEETGEINHARMIERADLRACREWGGPNPPPSYVREAHSWCLERARSERLQWRDNRGLPREDVGTLTDISEWTDTFRRVQ
jgi:hypothetical protein